MPGKKSHTLDHITLWGMHTGFKEGLIAVGSDSCVVIYL